MRRTNDEILTDFMNLDPASPTFNLDFLGVLIHKAADQTMAPMMNSTHDAQQAIDEAIMY